MARDINTKKLKKNAFRYSKVRGETASRIRIPGGVINAKSMARIAEVAEKYGNGTIFVTNRQGVELPGIALEDMDAIYAFAKNRGLKVSAETYMFPPVRSAKEGAVDEVVRFTPEEAGQARAKAELNGMTEKESAFRLKALHAGRNEFMCGDEDCTRTPDEKMGCMAGRSSFWITWDGRMTPCGMMNEPVARPFETGFPEAWKIICEETDQILLPPACKDCKKRFACMICGAVSIAEGHGDSTKKPEYLCKQTEVFLDEMEQEYQRRQTAESI